MSADVKVLVTGAGGMLGRFVVKKLIDDGYETVGADIDEFDLTVEDEVKGFILAEKPDVIIHTGAFTGVDEAEDCPERSHRVNVDGTRYVVESASEVGAYIIYISTDYVFDGEKGNPYVEEDIPNPINVYGRTKYIGEIEVRGYSGRWLIVRSAWLFGPSPIAFPVKVYRRAVEERELRVVNDQFGSPTYAKDLAEAVIKLMEKRADGIYHFVNSGIASRYDLAMRTLEYAGLLKGINLIEISTGDIESKAKRPPYSVLDTGKYERLFYEPRMWYEALKAFMDEYDISQIV